MKKLAKLLYFTCLLSIFSSSVMSQERIESISLENNFLSPDNQKLCAIIQTREKKGKELYILDIPSGKLTLLPVFLQKDFVFDIFSSFWFPDSEHLLAYFFVDQIHPRIYISSFFAKDMKLVGSKSDNNGPPYSLSPDGKYLIFCRLIEEATEPGSKENFALVLFDLKANSEKIISRDGFYWPNLKIFFSPDGQRVYYLKAPRNQIFGPPTLYCYSLVDDKTMTVIPKEVFEKEKLDRNNRCDIMMNYLASDSNFLGFKVRRSGAEKSWYELWVVDMRNRRLEKARDFERPSYWTPSPSLSKIVQSKKDESSACHIFIINLSLPDDQGQQITFGENDDIQPIWTWNEKQIIFVRNKTTIWIMNSDGTNQCQIFPKKDAGK